MTNITKINGGGMPDEMRDELRKLQANIQTVLESQAIVAQITRAKYDALTAQGFTQEQALELCK